MIPSNISNPVYDLGLLIQLELKAAQYLDSHSLEEVQ